MRREWEEKWRRMDELRGQVSHAGPGQLSQAKRGEDQGGGLGEEGCGGGGGGGGQETGGYVTCWQLFAPVGNVVTQLGIDANLSHEPQAAGNVVTQLAIDAGAQRGLGIGEAVEAEVEAGADERGEGCAGGVGAGADEEWVGGGCSQSVRLHAGIACGPQKIRKTSVTPQPTATTSPTHTTPPAPTTPPAAILATTPPARWRARAVDTPTSPLAHELESRTTRRTSTRASTERGEGATKHGLRAHEKQTGASQQLESRTARAKHPLGHEPKHPESQERENVSQNSLRTKEENIFHL